MTYCRSNLNVWAIQSNKEEIYKALKYVKKDSVDNILFLNCRSKLEIEGKEIVNKKFDSYFFSEEGDTLILFQKGTMDGLEIQKCLNEAGVKYSIVSFIEKKKLMVDEETGEIINIEEKSEETEEKDFWFARDKFVLNAAINDSLKKGNDECVYITNETASLTLGYVDRSKVKHEIEGRWTRGTLIFEDKIVLLVKQNDERNLDKKDVLKILFNKNIKVHTKKKSKINQSGGIR